MSKRDALKRRLFCGKTLLATVVADERWPGMWRVQTPDGALSDMVNLSRARDAAMVKGRKWASSHDTARWYWK